MISAPAPRRAAFLLALGLVLAGGALRFHQAWSHRNVYLSDTMQEEGYYESAIGLLSYQTFSIGVPNDTPRSWRGPIFPVFIALTESLAAEPDPGRVRLAQAALATLSILLVAALGAALVSPAAGLLGAALLALDPGQIAAVTSLNIHGFYSFLILAACAALVLWSERPTARSTALAGAFLGITLLCRSSHFLALPFMAAAAWRWRPLPGPRWRAPAFLLLGAALALAPMTLRNRAVTGRWLIFPDAFAGAVALFGATTGQQGLNSYAVEQAVELAEAAEPGFKKAELAGDEFHAAILDLAARRIAADPLRFLGLCLRRLGLLAAALWPPFLLGLAGLALQRRNRRLQIALILAFSFGGYCVAGGAPEHRAAAMPLLFLVAGCGGAIILGRAAGSAPPAPARLRGRLGAIMASGPAFGLGLYAVFLLALAVEARQRLWRGDPPAVERGGRALALLRRQAEQGSGEARRKYAENLSRDGVLRAGAGGCAAAEPSLRSALLLEPRQPGLAGTRAACLAAENDAARADALAAAYGRRPGKERAEFWDAVILQTEIVKGSAAAWVLEREPRPSARSARRLVGLWLSRASREAEAGELAAARRSLAKVEAMDLEDSDLRNIVVIYQKLKEIRGADRATAALITRRARDPWIWVDRADSALRAGKTNDAFRSLEQAERLGPLTPSLSRRVVGLYRELKDHRRASSALKPLLLLSPRDAGLWIEHAELSAQSGEADAARASLERAEKLGASDELQRRRIVGLYRQIKDPRRGAAALEPLLARAPRDAGLWIDRAEFSAQSRERDAALAALARAEGLPGLDAEARRRAVALYRELKEPRRGAAALEPLLKIEPRDPGLWLDRAEFSAQAGDRSAALASLARAEKLPLAAADRDGERRRRLALAYQSLGEHGRAAAILSELSRLFPDEGRFLADKGLCEYLGGDEAAALATLATAISRSPKFLPSYLTLGAIHAAKGRPAEALKTYDRGIARAPESENDPLRGALLQARAAAARETGAR